ncbi:unnamed protein product [Rotaria sp. Silwood2]|nr:unnamed protein product [Rotaria sp. Silwood2]CAF2935118.1 unnamed protein product [Rotaria sp. Silwood2]CAF3085720.1 unnamed protein product [Rotaria sp. Silwood2]CAF3325037.1 unnamed protein product [Rotaria sp. Silwood2]CAF3874927.1 unnamed protein product [Rotaria sp. Silwood2]
MAGTYDTEEQRIIDRIKCIAFREARDVGATFINRHWVANKVHRSVQFVTDWWEKPYDQCFADYPNAGRKLKLSQASQDIILKASDRQRKSCSIVALHWVIKDKGESWTGQYFRDIILTEHVFPFLKNEENVIDPDEVIFIHDKAPCMRAYQIQHFLQDNDVKFWGNDIWPGNSPDLNVPEHIGTIIKDEVEKKMLSEPRHSRYVEETLKIHILDVLKNMETDTDLFETLLCSYPSRLRAVKNANGRHTDY